MLVLMASSSSLQDPLGAIFICLLVHFYTFTLSSLVCSSRLLLNLLYLVFFMYVRLFFFLIIVLLVTPRSRFVQLQVCISFN